MGDFEFGSQEHIDGLSREALEADFRFVVDRMREAECEWERLKAENEKLRELVRQMYPGAKAFLQLGVRLGCNDTLSYDWWLQLRELGIEECAYEYS